VESVSLARLAAVSSEGQCDDSPVDLGRLMDVSSSNSEALRRLATNYLKQADELLVGLHQSILRCAAEEVRRLAHKLVGSSSTCGMTAVVPVLRRLEQLGEAGQLGEASELHEEAVRQVERVRRYLDDYFNGDRASDERATA
jgi:HPt (histidine-containing phosphotransfer) domain-containing protein